MASRPRTKMEQGDRAKQFMPFAALKGLPEALARRERIAVPKIEIPEDRAVELDRKLQLVASGTQVTIVYYQKGEYQRVTGVVTHMDQSGRLLQLADRRIRFADVLDMELEEASENHPMVIWGQINRGVI